MANTGSCAGSEVVQLYVAAPSGLVSRPPRELRAFHKAAIEPGASVEVRFVLGWRDFAFFHPGLGRWQVEAGQVGIDVGASSRDIRLTSSGELPVRTARVPLTASSTLREWADRPAALAALEREMTRHDAHAPGLRFTSERGIRALGSTPLSRLANFPGSSLDPDRLVALIAEVNGG